MKTWTYYIISVLLICVSCNVEQKQQLEFVGSTGNNECRMFQVRIPKDWKIVNAQLDFNQVNIEFDRGRGIEKQSLTRPFKLDGSNERLIYRGTNRLDGLTLLHFTTEEDPQSKFNPPLGRSQITTSIKEREEFAIFRTSNWLIIHYSIKNTGLGDLTFHNLTKRYAKHPNNNRDPVSFKTIDGKMHYNLVFNNKEKRSFLIDEYYGQHETYNSSSLSSIKSNNELSWTWRYKITTNQILDR